MTFTEGGGFYGLPVTVRDSREPGSTADDTCVKVEYTGWDASVWGATDFMVGLPAVEATYVGADPCTSGMLVERTDTKYDGVEGAATLGSHPSDGNVTAEVVYTAAAGGSGGTVRSEATYDGFGRVTSQTSPNQVAVGVAGGTPRPKTLTYVAPAGYPAGYPVRVEAVDEFGTTDVDVESYFRAGQASPYAVKDINQRWTWIDLDAFTRPTAVWLPTEGGPRRSLRTARRTGTRIRRR